MSTSLLAISLSRSAFRGIHARTLFLWATAIFIFAIYAQNTKIELRQQRVVAHIRCYRNDIQFFSFCLRSLEKFGGFLEGAIVTVPEVDKSMFQQLLHTTTFPVKLVASHYPVVGDAKSRISDFLAPRLDFLNIDSMTDADYIMLLDSDSVLIRDLKETDLFFNDKIIFPYDDIDHPDMVDTKRVWKPSMDHMVGVDCPYEFMRRQGMVFPRWAFAGFRDRIATLFNQSMAEYALSTYDQGLFTEWNPMGAYLYFFHKTNIHWEKGWTFNDSRLHTMSQSELRDMQFVEQVWSHAGVQPEHVAFFECILRDGKFKFDCPSARAK